jgi:uncharacterized integral membrane protein
MSVLIWVVRVLFFIVVFAFAARNLVVVDVNGFLGYHWQAPLALVLLAALGVGVLLGIYGTVRLWWGLRGSPTKATTDVKPAPPPTTRYRPSPNPLGNDEGA